MDLDGLISYNAQKAGVEETFPFDEDTLVFKVMGKMFAYVSVKAGTPVVTLKCVPLDGEILAEQFEAIAPGYHMNKKHWITIALKGAGADEVSDDMVKDLASKSYELVVSKLTKANKVLLAKVPDPMP